MSLLLISNSIASLHLLPSPVLFLFFMFFLFPFATFHCLLQNLERHICFIVCFECWRIKVNLFHLWYSWFKNTEALTNLQYKHVSRSICYNVLVFIGICLSSTCLSRFILIESSFPYIVFFVRIYLHPLLHVQTIWIFVKRNAEWKPLQFLAFIFFYRIFEKLKAFEPVTTPVLDVSYTNFLA